MNILLGYDHIVNKKIISPNGKTKAATSSSFTFPWALERFQCAFSCFTEHESKFLASTDHKWLFPISPLGAANHWLFEEGADLIFSKIEPWSLQAIQSGSAYVLIDYSHEGNGYTPNTFDIFQALHQRIQTADIPPNKVIFLFGNLLAEAQYEKWIAEHKITSKVHIISVSFFDLVVGLEFKNYQFAHRKALSQKLKGPLPEQSFLSFNRRAHPHRLALCLGYAKLNLLDKGLVSLNDTECLTYDWRMFLREFFDDSYIADLMRAESELRQRIPLRVDLNSDENLANDPFNTTPYLNTRFSVVAETTFHDLTNLFISEKSFKPIIYGHPFIILGHQHTLSQLQRQGYRTFSPFFNEAYDEIADPQKRFIAVLSEIDRLCRLPVETWQSFAAQLNDICEFNYEHFVNSHSQQSLSVVKKIHSLLER